MPSPIAHALGGVAVAWVADVLAGRRSGPAVSSERPPAGSRVGLTCACLAAFPDVDLLLPITHRTATHSLAAVAFVGVLMIIAASVTGKVTTKIALTYMAAYASHLLLDWLQADPTPPFGLQLLWPFSSAWFISGWSVFRATDRRHVLEVATMKRNAVAMLQELAIMAPVLAALWLVRVKTLARLAPEVPRGDHSP
jgi:membrane-bound metal-dependent hydrolase YbcI (DUF457 family)